MKRIVFLLAVFLLITAMPVFFTYARGQSLGTVEDTEHYQIFLSKDLAGSFVEFDPAEGGDPEYLAGETQDFVFRAESFTTDWEWAYGFWLNFPDGWIINSVVYMEGSCDNGSISTTFSYQVQDPANTVRINQTRNHANPADHCIGWYMVNVTVPAYASGNAYISWYWWGDGWGGAPNNPCSDDGYTPPDQDPCDEALNPQAMIPEGEIVPGIYILPEMQSSEVCIGHSVDYLLTITNFTGEDLNIFIDYYIEEGAGDIDGPESVNLDDGESEEIMVTLTPDIMMEAGEFFEVKVIAHTGIKYNVEAIIISEIIDRKWINIATEPDNGRGDNVVVAYDGRIWSITGSGPDDNVRYYDPETDTWTTVVDSAPPFGENYARSGAVYGSKVFIYGDASTAEFEGLWSYDMDENLWLNEIPSGTPPPHEGIWSPAWVSDPDTGYLYITGGATASGGGDLTTVFVYDPETNAWLDPLPEFDNPRAFHAAFILDHPITGNKILVVSGGVSALSVVHDSNETYDFVLEEWIPGTPPLPRAMWGMGYAHNILDGNDEGWFVGGADASFDLINDSIYLDWQSGEWVEAGIYHSTTVYRTSAAALNGEVYKIGGYAGGFTNTGLASKNSPCEPPVVEYTVTIEVFPDTIYAFANPLGAGLYEAGELVEVEVSEVDNYFFMGWESDPEVVFSDPEALIATFTMPGQNITLTAYYDEDDPPECTLEEALDNLDLTWTTSTSPVGLDPWYCQTEVWEYGGSAAQSGAITHSQNTSLHTTVDGPGTLTFWWKVDSENNWDWLRFYINGSNTISISGDQDWHEVTMELGAGENNLTWTYMKDGSVSVGQDCGWVDNVMFVPAGEQYSVTMAVDPDAIEGDADPQGAGDYEEGDTVSISVQAVAGYNFTGWTSVPAVTFADESALSTTFTMPADDVVVTANYTPLGNPGDTCDDPIIVSIPADLNYSDIGQTNCGRGNSYEDDASWYNNGEDIFYRLDVTEDTWVIITMVPDATWTGLFLYSGCPDDLDPGDWVAMVANSANAPRIIEIELLADNSPYFIMCDSWPSPVCYEFDLHIELLETDEFTVTIEVDPDTITADANPQGAGLYEEGDLVEVEVSEVDNYTFLGWTSDPEVTFSDPEALIATFTMPGQNITITANYEEDDPDECTLEEALDNPDLTWTVTTEPVGLEPWYCQTEVWEYGGSAAQSGAITHNESTSMHTTVHGPGTLTFWWKVDSEPNFDFLDFYINGGLMSWISGDQDWHEMTYELDAGENILTWTYMKDGSVSVGQDCGWVDYVMFEPAEQGPDASISSGGISYSPSDPLPGDTVTITARVYNVGTEDITSGNANFYYSLEPGIDLEPITVEAFGLIEAGDYLDITIDWDTDEDMDPMIYIITIVLTDIMPEDINLDNNTAYIELALPIELAYFSAVGIINRANIRWMTLSETDNLGFNLYRLNVSNVNPYITFLPVKLNTQLIPGQGTTSEPHTYTYTDHGINRFFDYIYILEAVSVYGETTEYRTAMMRIGRRQIIFQ